MNSAAAASGRQDKRAPKHMLTEAERFKIIDGVKVERQVVEYNAEEEKQAQMRQEQDRTTRIYGKKVIHRHVRSASRSRSASNKAKNRIRAIDDQIESNQSVSKNFQDARDAIAEAAIRHPEASRGIATYD